MLQKIVLSVAIPIALVAGPAFADGHKTEIVTSQHTFQLEKIADGLEHPWGLDFLPDGKIIVTERPGRIRIVSTDGKLSEPVANVPEIVSDFRDGLLDVSVSPDFANDSMIFFSYSKKEGDLRWLEVISAKLEGNALKNLKTIHAAEVKVEKDQGFGSRIRFDQNGDMVISVGDHAVVANAQDSKNTLGTIIRIKTDGTPVDANPKGDLNPAILALGFKNPQGLTIHPETGDIWASDHGGVGGGELNKVVAGGNYGWPVRTFSGGDAPRAVKKGDFVEPVFTWGAAPTVSLSGLEVYTGNDFESWKGDLFTGSLSQGALIRVILNDADQVIGTEYVIDGDIGRVREVRQGTDGMLYLLNDDPEGGIFRMSPK